MPLRPASSRGRTLNLTVPRLPAVCSKQRSPAVHVGRYLQTGSANCHANFDADRESVGKNASSQVRYGPVDRKQALGRHDVKDFDEALEELSKLLEAGMQAGLLGADRRHP